MTNLGVDNTGPAHNLVNIGEVLFSHVTAHQDAVALCYCIKEGFDERVNKGLFDCNVISILGLVLVNKELYQVPPNMRIYVPLT